MRVDDHQDEQGDEEHDRACDGDAIEILLDDARARLRRIHGACDGIGDARPLARMHEDEDDEADARQEQQHQEDDYQGSQLFTLLSIG